MSDTIPMDQLPPETPGKRPRPHGERRAGADRRKVDKGPPGGRERRMGIEPRRPDVVEREPTPSEWDALKGIAQPPAKPAK